MFHIVYILILYCFFITSNAMEMSSDEYVEKEKKEKHTEEEKKLHRIRKKALIAALENLEPGDLLRRSLEELSVLSYTVLKKVPFTIGYAHNREKLDQFRMLLDKKRKKNSKRALFWVLNNNHNFNCTYLELKGNLPLLWAIDELPCEEVFFYVKQLIEKGTKVNACYVDTNENALMRAVSRRLPNVVKLLLDHKADPVQSDKYKLVTPLLLAAEMEEIESATFLLQCKEIDINWRNRRNKSALSRAIKKKKLEMINFLLENGAEITAKDKKMARRSTIPQIRESIKSSKKEPLQFRMF